VPDVVILTLRDPHSGTGEGCVCGLTNDTGQAAETGQGCGGEDRPRVPVLECADALRDEGARVDLVTACDEREIDAALKGAASKDAAARLIVAAASDAELRAVVRRLVRMSAPPPSKRPAALPPNRTIYDLPPLAVLPLTPAVPDLVRTLGLPASPKDVASAVMKQKIQRYDLLRTDSGSATLGGALLGGVIDGGLSPWRGRVEVDDAVLTDGEETVLACAVRNLGSSDVDGLPLVVDADPADGRVEVAVAVPVMKRRLWREATVAYEVRRAQGRAVSVLPRGEDVHYVDDGVKGTLGRKRSWWVEADAWGLYVM
jgi:hypothetical protein